MEVKKNVVISLAVVLVLLLGLAVGITLLQKPDSGEESTVGGLNIQDGTTEAVQTTGTDETQDTSSVETTEKVVEVLLPEEGEGDLFGEEDSGDGPSIGVDVGGQGGNTQGGSDSQGGNTQGGNDSQTTNPTAPEETTAPTEGEGDSEATKPSQGEDGEWDHIIDFDDLLKPKT